MPSFYSRPPTFIGGNQPDAARVQFPLTPLLAGALSDNAGIGDYYFVTDAGRSLADTAVTGDSLTGSISGNVLAALTDAAASSDAFSVTGVSFFDTNASSDSVFYVYVDIFSGIFSSQFGGTTFFGFTAFATVPDATVCVDGFTLPGNWIASLADNATLADSFVQTAFFSSISDATLSYDIFVKTQVSATIPLDVSNTLDLLNFTVNTGNNSLALADFAVISESFIQSNYFIRFTDTANSNDTTSYTFVSSGVDPFTFEFTVDFGGGAFTAAQITGDLAGTGDTQSAILQIATIALSDATATSDTIAYPHSTALSDANATGDLITSTGIIFAALSDARPTTDTLNGALSIATFAQSDNNASGDTLSFITGYVAARSDTAASADVWSSFFAGSVFVLSDASVTADPLSGIVFINTIALADGPAIADQFLALNMSTGLSDAAAVADTTGATAAIAATLSTDSATATDNFINPGTYTRALSDSAASVDSLTGSNSVLSYGMTDAAFTADTISPVAFNFAVSLSDSNNDTDLITPALFALVSSLNDFSITSDQIAAGISGIFSVTVFDNATVAADSLTGISAFASAMGDAGASVDVFIGGALGAALADSATAATDALSFISGYPFALSDSAATSDTVAAPAGFNAVAALPDVAASLDTLVGIDVAIAALSDSGTLVDTLLKSNYIGVLSDSAPVVDTIFGSVFVAPLALGDTLVSVDSFAWTAFSVALSDAVAAVDVLTLAGIAYTGNLSDISVTFDALSSAYTTATNTADFANTIDTIIPDIVVFTTTQGDNANTFAPLTAAGFGTVVSLTDFIANSDVVNPNAFSTSLTDSAFLNDNVSFVNVSAGFADAAGSFDTLTPTFILATGWSDPSIGISDYTTVVVASLTLSDSAATADALSAVVTPTASLADVTASSADTISQTVFAVAASLPDISSDADTLTPVFVSVAALSDSGVSRDAPLGTAISLSLNDVAIINDLYNFNTAGAYFTTLLDIILSNDSFIGQAAALTFSDTAGSVDILTPAIPAFSQSLTDAIPSSGDTLTLAAVVLAGTTDDSSATNDSITIISASLTAGDNTSTMDSISYTIAGNTIASLNDVLSSSDTLLARAVSLSLIDVAATGDSFTSAKGFPAVLADLMSDSDAWSIPATGYAVTYADSLLGSDAWSSPGASTISSVTAIAVPTGGAVLLQFPGFFSPVPGVAALTIERSVQGSNAWVLIYQGPPIGVFLDVGDSLPQPLDGNTAYIWNINDGISSIQVGPITPASSFVNEPDQLTQVLIRALQGIMNSMVLPPGVQPAVVTIKMPVNGWAAMPFIVINLDLIQQTETNIGEDFAAPNPANVWTLFANAKRVWRVTVISQAAEERDFYRDSLLAAFRILKATAFAPIGYDVSHTFSATSYSSTSEWEGLNPGFYGADLMLEINGIFPAAVLTNYPLILDVASNPTFDPNTFIEQVLP